LKSNDLIKWSGGQPNNYKGNDYTLVQSDGLLENGLVDQESSDSNIYICEFGKNLKNHKFNNHQL
jgi:hypothetical protein